MQWFDVDRAGLAKLMERRGKEFILFELIQNGWDQNVTYVDLKLERVRSTPYVTITVEDDDPDGFKDLTHSFTLFAESEKKGDATRRGRFNLGEKLVLALCEEATITSTTGGVRFDAAGRHRLRTKRSRGSVFMGRLRMTNDEMMACSIAMSRLLVPPKIKTIFNGECLEPRTPLATIAATLPTEIADAEGNLRRTTRKTSLIVYAPRDGETGTLYEMGIPVVETGDGYHVDVQQKVPLNFDRDNVPPAYLREVRTLVVNAMHTQLDPETANAGWVRDALTDSNIDIAAVQSIIKQRFGDRVVAYDPSDAEANKLAVSHGYVVVSGGQFSKNEWANVRRASAMLPAGQVTPSPKPFSDDPNATALKMLDPDKWSATERRFVAAVERLGRTLLGFAPIVSIAVDITWPFAGTYARGGRLTINKGRLGAAFFDQISEDAVAFLLHEFGHEYSGDHLSHEYHDALNKLGAKLAFAVANDPSLLEA